ncbi:monovalent cation/H+ antiporter subunit A [Coralloluteibacterium stylophorae]|uniref:Monovalent cation/H+ antiporter subunit A n=1 Tax=Coralloluteibacterium stylophorae TaxID=1776034 RepID=A0A8J8AYX1_9GAMM|nr:monovalent cation/H+ antiporter subunit A [Coralloluteibacterium stylophorae]
MLEALLALPFALALLIACMTKASRRTIAWTAAVAPLGGLAILGLITPRILDGETVRSTVEWVPAVGLDLILRVDGLGWMFGGLVLAIGALIVLYAAYYLDPRDSARRFFATLLMFMGAMLGLAISGNLLQLVVFWELTSISSFLLIGFWKHRHDARVGARMALAVTGGGGLALLGGVVLLGRIVGSYELDAILAAGELVRAHALYPAALVLILLGAFTKSAQFPFSFWLPHAMAAPTPVSAYLHSAAMVKAGVFLLARLHPTLAGSELFAILVVSTGAATFVISALFAIWQHDLKGLLAYSTLSHLGLITMLFGLSAPMAVVAGLFHMLNHATFKASLFMSAGIIDHETGTRDLRRLGGLRKLMPVTSALAMIATLSMAGVPLLNGFLSKEMFFTEAAAAGDGPISDHLLTLVATVGGVLSMAYSLRFLRDAFFGDAPRDVAINAHEPPRFMRVPVEILVAVCVLVGLLPAFTIGPILEAGARGVLGPDLPDYDLAIWHGFNLPLAMSIVSLVGGLLLYATLQRRTDIHAKQTPQVIKTAYEHVIHGLYRLSCWLTSRIENGSLQRMMVLLVVAVAVMALAPFVQGHALGAAQATQPLPLLGALLWVLIVAGALGTVLLHHQRMKAVIVIGAAGLGVSLAFVVLSAPDLALTQLLVEIATIALMLLAMNFLPQVAAREPRARRLRDALLALAGGSGVAVLTWAVLTRPLDTVAGEMLARALPQGGGTNVVNIILVDFRGFDTMGEITVFAIAGLLVHALLRTAKVSPERAWPDAMRLTIPQVVVQLLLPLAIAVAVYLFLRGHNEPGGGFIAGLVLAVPLLLQYVVIGLGRPNPRLAARVLAMIGIGLLLAVGTGAGAIAFGHPFLTSAHGHPALPLVGHVPLASVMIFDLGVFMVVAGTILLALLSLARAAHPETIAGVGDGDTR